MSIIGITASKDYLYLAMTTAEKEHFKIHKYNRIPVNSNDWPSLVKTLSTFLGSFNAEDMIEKVALVCCSSGKYKASSEAFKAEGFAELKCQECGYPVSQLTKQSLSKHLNCQSGQNWKDAANEVLNR